MGETIRSAARPSDTPAKRRCVLWRSPDDAHAARLCERLQGRGAPVLAVAYGAEVMRELARGDVGVVIFCEPRPEPERGELEGALRRYYPQVVRWEQRVEADDQVRLVKLGPADGRCDPGATPPPMSLPVEEGRRSGHGAREILPITPILTPEELEMLLGEPLATPRPAADDDDGL